MGNPGETWVGVNIKNQYQNLGHSENNNESDDEEPFIRDTHGFKSDSSTFEEYIGKGVIDHGISQSYKEAVKIVEVNDIFSPELQNNVLALYTCEFCRLVFTHPKRYLIHCKWHNYGPPKEVILRETNLNPIKKNKKAEVKEEGSLEDGNEDQDGHFECDICKQFYRTRRSLNNHRSRLHYATPKECKICNKSFSNTSYLRSHMLTHSEGGSFTCTQCPKKFKFLHSLQRHIPTHYEDKNFPCSGCEKSFGSDLLLKIHSKTHMKELIGKHFKCSFCTKTFYQSFRLVAHERTHTGEKPFQCNICKQKYPTNSSLNRHLRVSHSTQLPFACEFCGKGFHIRSAWDHHVRRSHLKERPHACQECDAAYSCQSDLAKHHKRVHEKVDESMLTGHPIEDSQGPSKVKKKKKLKRRRKEYSDESS